MQRTISIIIPARNEENLLPKCIAAIELAAKEVTEEIEVVVVANRCTDNTEQVAQELNCKVVKSNAKNLSVIRNTGIKAATGQVIITIDADSEMSKNLLEQVILTLKSDKYVGGGVMIYPERWSLGIFLSILALVPFCIFWGITAGVFFARKEDILAIGGFNEEMFSAEDVDFARRLKAYGKSKKMKFKNLFNAHIITSCRKFDRFGDWYAIKHPLKMLKLLRGKKSKEADEIWYDF